MSQQGLFIVVDAIDGAGKSTALQAISKHLESKGKRLFDLVAFQKEHHRLPELAELADVDVLLSAEPTYSWAGLAVREELIKAHADRVHSGKVTAEGFSLDRYVLFSRVVLPFLNERPGRVVIQDRGVITSLAYQPLQDPSITLEWLQSLSGNALELSRPPELLFLLRITPEEAMERLSKRTEKQDGVVFENTDFQARVAMQYRSEAVLAPYKNGGTKVIEIDATQTPEQVAQALISYLPTF